GSDLVVPLYRITEVRDVTCSAEILASAVISSSVMPSAKYCCWGSSDRFASGSTASDSIFPGAARERWRTKRNTATAAAATRSATAHRRRERGARGPEGPAANGPPGDASLRANARSRAD